MSSREGSRTPRKQIRVEVRGRLVTCEAKGVVSVKCDALFVV